MPNSNDVLFDGKVFTVVRWQGKTPGGTEVMREVVRHPGAVVLLPLLDDGRICLIKNFRAAVDKTLVELPAGTLESGEPPLETARRELIEETGYRGGQFEQIAAFYVSPGILDERMHVVVARELTPGQPAREHGEEIDNLLTSYDDALAMVRDGTIEDAKTINALLLYDRFHRT